MFPNGHALLFLCAPATCLDACSTKRRLPWIRGRVASGVSYIWTALPKDEIVSGRLFLAAEPQLPTCRGLAFRDEHFSNLLISLLVIRGPVKAGISFVTKLSVILLVVAPLPVISGCVALARWARYDPVAAAAPNTVQVLTATQRNKFPAESHGVVSRASHRAADAIRRRSSGQLNTIVRSPFIVAGDLPVEELARLHDSTLRPAAEALWRNFFQTRPNEPVQVFLFGTDASYQAHSQRMFSQQPQSIYGYYKPAKRAVVVSVAAGTGTLIHELTHALIDFDHANVPLWFNEGLASLFEESEIEMIDGEVALRPKLNWRLPILQNAIQEGQLDSIGSLIQADRMRGANEAVNYAQARYFCLWLHQKQLLRRYYQLLRSSGTEDPQGATPCWRCYAMTPTLRRSRKSTSNSSAGRASCRRSPIQAWWPIGVQFC